MESDPSGTLSERSTGPILTPVRMWASANTFGASPLNLDHMGVSEKAEDLNRAAVRIARGAAGNGQYVAADFGSLGGMLEPPGRDFR